jgi:hypothetical protein
LLFSSADGIVTPFRRTGFNPMRRKAAYSLVLFVLTLLFVPVFFSPLSAAGKTKCLSCHKKLTKGKFVHQALQMGCPACHSAINAGTVPHGKTNAIVHGLSSDQPDLC